MGRIPAMGWRGRIPRAVGSPRSGDGSGAGGAHGKAAGPSGNSCLTCQNPCQNPMERPQNRPETARGMGEMGAHACAGAHRHTKGTRERVKAGV